MRFVALMAAVFGLGFAGQAAAATVLIADFEKGYDNIGQYSYREIVINTIGGGFVGDGGYRDFRGALHGLSDDYFSLQVGNNPWFKFLDAFVSGTGTVEFQDYGFSYIDDKAVPLATRSITLTSTPTRVKTLFDQTAYIVIHVTPGSSLVLDDLKVIGGSDLSVPEPETWAMMILGLGLVGAAVRTRRPRARCGSSLRSMR
jgi:hypothetical protein